MAVYFIQQGDGGPIKIGFSDRPARRIEEIGKHIFPGVNTIAVIDYGSRANCRALERTLHRHFASLRVRGEWFRPSDELLKWIREYTDRRGLGPFGWLVLKQAEYRMAAREGVA